MNFWAGKHVLVTGHTGFKGGWLALALNRDGARVAGLSLEPETEPSLFHGARLASLTDSHIGDIRNIDTVTRVFGETRPEVVFHMAAQPLVRRSYRDPIGTYETNVMGTVHVLEAVRSCESVRTVVVVTSDKCYENRETVWAYRESDAMGGSDPYSSSKGCTELVAAAYRRSYFAAGQARLATARAGNVIGGGDWSEDRLVPDCVRAFSRGETVVLRNPQSVRPWQHVLEPLSGYLMLARKLHSGEAPSPAYNFGPASEELHPVIDVVRGFAERWPGSARWKVESDGSLHEAGLLAVDSTRARVQLGWKPRLTFEESVQWTAEWYSRQLAGEDMRSLTLEQIERFFAK